MNIDASRTPATASLCAAPSGLPRLKVDISRGERIGRVSSEWFSRPDDERYLVPVGPIRLRMRPDRAGDGTDGGEPGRSRRGEAR